MRRRDLWDHVLSGASENESEPQRWRLGADYIDTWDGLETVTIDITLTIKINTIYYFLWEKNLILHLKQEIRKIL